MTNKKLILNPWVLTSISGILLVLSFPPFDLHFLAWIALVPFLYSVANAEPVKKTKLGISIYEAQALGILLGAVFYYGTLYWLYNIFGIFGLLLVSVCLLYTLLFAHAVSFVLSKWNTRFALLFFPAILWVAIEYFKSEGWWLKFSWMNLGYSQHSSPLILQTAGIFGQYGISFLIVLMNSTIVFLIMNRADKKLVFKTSVVAALCFGLVLCYGIFSLREGYEPDIKVALVQDESSDFSVYARLTRQLSRDVDFILWPEYAIPELLEEEPDLLDRLRGLAIQKNSYLILGAKDRSEAYSSDLRARMMIKQGYSEQEIDELFRFYNTAYLFSPNGEIIGKYHKANPIQFFVDGVAGKEFPVFETAAGKAGIFICYDADYSYVARRIAGNGAEMFFIPTYDGLSWSELQHKQHSAMTSMRAVENGRFIARATTSGISQIIDPNGRITASIGLAESGITEGLIERIDRLTFYTRYGYLFPFICIIASLSILAYALLMKKSALAKDKEFHSDRQKTE